MERYRRCSTCDVVKPLIAFYLRSNGTYYNHCKECQKAKTMISRHKNVEGYREYQNKYHNEPQNKIAANLRTRLKTALLSYEITIDRNIPETHGAPISFIHLFLEFTKQFFIPQDYSGTLHIDHLFPISRFNLYDPSQVKFVSNWSNFRYLTAHDNISKGANMPSKQDIEKQATICHWFLFLTQNDHYHIQQFDINMHYFEKLYNLNNQDYWYFSFRK